MPGKGEVLLDGASPRYRALAARLSQEDAPLAANPQPSVDDVRNALKRFQTRNGIHVDGLANERTLAMLNVPIGVRIAQITANLERLRWMPQAFEEKYILVNVPDETVKFISNGEVLLESRAIVGRPSSRTPIARMTAEALIVNPPWHVPEDIAAAQILPKLQQNPNYLAARNMILADGPAGDPHGRTLDWRNMKTMPYLIDQNPGPASAMGRMMLDAPNNFGVYLHDTPEKALFQASKRQASNGCIRVENMLELSALILGGEHEQTVEELKANIAAGQTQRLPLDGQIAVYLLYQTAIAYPDGTIGFRGDLYGRDKPLAAALMAAAQ